MSKRIPNPCKKENPCKKDKSKSTLQDVTNTTSKISTFLHILINRLVWNHHLYHLKRLFLQKLHHPRLNRLKVTNPYKKKPHVNNPVNNHKTKLSTTGYFDHDKHETDFEEPCKRRIEKESALLNSSKKIIY